MRTTFFSLVVGLLLVGCATTPTNPLPVPTTLSEAKQQIATLQKSGATCEKKLTEYKDGNISALKRDLRWVSLGCFLVALGFAAAGFYLGMTGGFKVAIMAGSAAAISAFTSVYLKTILLVTGGVIGLVAVGYAIYIIHKYQLLKFLDRNEVSSTATTRTITDPTPVGK